MWLICSLAASVCVLPLVNLQSSAIGKSVSWLWLSVNVPWLAERMSCLPLGKGGGVWIRVGASIVLFSRIFFNVIIDSVHTLVGDLKCVGWGGVLFIFGERGERGWLKSENWSKPLMHSNSNLNLKGYSVSARG